MHKIQLLKWTLDIIFDTLQWLIVVNVFYMSMWKKLFYNSLIFDFNLLMELSQRVAGPQFTKRKFKSLVYRVPQRALETEYPSQNLVTLADTGNGLFQQSKD